jgi:head-tail adaptor
MSFQDLKNRITFIEKTEITSPNGFKESTWTEVKKTWSSVSVGMKVGTRTVKADNKELIEEVPINFQIRYQTVDKNYRIRFKEKDYEILYIADETFDKKYLTITAKEVV